MLEACFLTLALHVCMVNIISKPSCQNSSSAWNGKTCRALVVHVMLSTSDMVTLGGLLSGRVGGMLSSA